MKETKRIKSSPIPFIWYFCVYIIPLCHGTKRNQSRWAQQIEYHLKIYNECVLFVHEFRVYRLSILYSICMIFVSYTYNIYEKVMKTDFSISIFQSYFVFFSPFFLSFFPSQNVANNIVRNLFNSQSGIYAVNFSYCCCRCYYFCRSAPKNCSKLHTRQKLYAYDVHIASYIVHNTHKRKTRWNLLVFLNSFF